MEKIDNRVKLIERDFRTAYNARQPEMKLRTEWEEFYFNDVENTKGQLTKKQLETVKSTYNIPISTKITYPIVEQILAFLTAMKPFPKLVGSDEAFSEMIGSLSKAYAAVWYESHAYQELRLAIRDMLLVGYGCLYVRPNTFYNESTFNTIIEYVHWKHIIVDPGARKEDMSDAEYIIMLDVLPRKKAERVYDIKITDQDIKENYTEFSASDFGGIDEAYGYDDTNKEEKDKKQYVHIKNHFAKEEVNLYISDKGDLTSIKPVPIEIDNPAYLELKGKLDEALQQSEASKTDTRQAKRTTKDLVSQEPDPTNPDAFQANAQDMGNAQEVANAGQEQSKAISDAIIKMKSQLMRTPKKIDGFRFYLTEENFYECESYSRTVRKQIRRTLLVGRRIVEREVLPMDKYPIIFFTFNHLRSPNKTYGIPHYIQDLVRAQNKYWSMMLHDMQTNGHRKVLFFEHTVAQPTNVESRWAVPGAWIAIKGDSSLPNGGMPTVLEPSPMNQSIQFILGSFKDLIEYVVGLFSISQGDPSQAPSTFGATMNIQSFGNQRVKLYTRNMERALEDLAYVTVRSLNANAPKDKLIKYIDPNGKEESVTLIDNAEDLQFKVRVDITNTMPTQRQMFAQLLSNVIAQTKNQGMSDLLTETMLKVLDMPEAVEVAQKIDVVQNLQSQTASMEEELKKKDGMIQSLQYQIALKDSNAKTQLMAEQVKGDIEVEKTKQLAEINAQGQQSTQPDLNQLPVEEQAQMQNQVQPELEESAF